MKSRTRFSKKKRGIQCLNCGQPISSRDNFCSNCGQVNDELPLSIKQFIADFFAGFFSFDTRFFKTFIPLLFKPGRVPLDYVEGKRMRYVNPFQLYLHVTIVFFLMQGLFSALNEYKLTGSFTKDKELTNQKLDSTLNLVNENIDKVEQDLSQQGIQVNIPAITSNDSINEEIADSILTKYNINFPKKSVRDSIINTNKAELESHIDSVIIATSLIENLKNDSLSIKDKDSIFMKFYNSNINFIEKLADSRKIKNWNQIEQLSGLKSHFIYYLKDVFDKQQVNFTIPEKASVSFEDELLSSILGKSAFARIRDFMNYDELHEDATALEAIEALDYEKSRWNVFYFKKAQDLNKFKDDAEFRKSYLDSIVSKISIALFFLLPVFTIFLSILYVRRKYNYTEHLVFVFNVQTVFFLLLIFLIIFDRLLNTDIGKILFIPVFLFYLKRAMKNFYKQYWLKTIIKFLLLNIIYLLLSIVGFVIISFVAFVI